MTGEWWGRGQEPRCGMRDARRQAGLAASFFCRSSFCQFLLCVRLTVRCSADQANRQKHQGKKMKSRKGGTPPAAALAPGVRSEELRRCRRGLPVLERQSATRLNSPVLLVTNTSPSDLACPASSVS